MVAGQNWVAICNECVVLCGEIFAEHSAPNSSPSGDQ